MEQGRYFQWIAIAIVATSSLNLLVATPALYPVSLLRNQPTTIQQINNRIHKPIKRHGDYAKQQVARHTSARNRLRELRHRNPWRVGRLEGSDQPVERHKGRAKAVRQQDAPSMPAPELNEPRRAAKVARQRAHVRAVVNAVVDARVFGREQVVVWRIGGHEHSVADQGSPPHGLLFGDWGDGPDAGADEADECNVWARGVDDVADVGLRGGRIAGIEPVEDLLVAAGLLSRVRSKRGQGNACTLCNIRHSLAGPFCPSSSANPSSPALAGNGRGRTRRFWSGRCTYQPISPSLRLRADRHTYCQ